MTTYPLIDRIRHPALKRLFGYWIKLSGTDAIALKSEFDPVDLPAELWPRLHMIDIAEDETICHNRLLGTYVVDAVGFDFTARPLIDAEIPGVSNSVTYELLQKLRGSSEPQHYYGPANFGQATRFAAHEQILLPLFDKGGRIVAAIGALDYQGFTPGLFAHKSD